MKVYVCYEYYFDFCNEFKSVVKIVDTEAKALEWVDAFTPTENECRFYQECDVE